MFKPRILDLYSCAGGAAKGYADAGFEVVGVDIDPQPRYPYEFHQADALAFVAEHGHEFDVIHGSPPCFAEGTPVLTRRGSVDITEVEAGDEVWTHRNRWRRVTDTMSRKAETVTIGHITTTPDHPFYAARQYRWYAGREERPKYPWSVGEPEWVNAEGTQGLFISSPHRFNGVEGTFPCSPWLAGRYVADGWTGRDGLMVAVGKGKEAEFEEKSGLAHWVTNQSGPNCTRYTVAGREIAERLAAHFGEGAHGKTVPSWVLSASTQERVDFLSGYLSGDGTETGNGWVANTVSTNLASQLRLLALSLGYAAGIGRVRTPDTKVIEGRVVNQGDYWSVRITTGRGRYTRDGHGLHWFKQRHDVVPAGVQDVYDITVEEDHSFTAWGVIVHNCQTFSRTKTLHDNDHPDLVAETRDALTATGKPWVIENVVGAPLVDPLRLCGTEFGMVAPDVDGVPLKLVRHRLFESNAPLMGAGGCRHDHSIQTASIYGAGGGWTPRHRDNPERRGGYIPHISVIKELLGIDWMTKHELSQSIPPIFTEHVGRQLIDHITNPAAAGFSFAQEAA